MKKIILGVDCGKNCVKVKSGKVKFKFENLVLQDNSVKKPSNDNSFEVVVDDRYLVGDKVNALKDYTSNKVTEFNRIAIYTAIAKTLEKLNVTEKVAIKLVTGLPNEHYTESNVINLKQLLCNDISMMLNDTAVEFEIKQNDLLVITENYSVDYEDTPKTLLLDLGYRNVNANTLEYGNMLQEHMKHSELGVHVLKSKIADGLQKQNNNYYNIKDISDNIVVNGLPNNSESEKFISNGKTIYLEELRNDLISKGLKLDTFNKMALRGGGTKLITLEQLKKSFPNFNSDNAIVVEGDEYKNVEIFEAVAKQYFAE